MSSVVPAGILSHFRSPWVGHRGNEPTGRHCPAEQTRPRLVLAQCRRYRACWSSIALCSMDCNGVAILEEWLTWRYWRIPVSPWISRLKRREQAGLPARSAVVLGGREGAELVALRVEQHRPVRAGGRVDGAEDAGAQPLQPGQILAGPQLDVEVEAVLDPLRLRDQHEENTRAVVGRQDHHRRVVGDVLDA